MDEERLLSLKDAATRFELSHSHLRLLARSGKLRARRMGRDWFTTEEAVAEYLRSPDVRRRTHRPSAG